MRAGAGAASAQGKTWSCSSTTGPRSKSVEPRLLEQLAAQRRLVALARLDAAAGRPPPARPRHLVRELAEEHAVVGVEHDRADRPARLRLDPGAQLAEPAQPLLVGNGGVGRRGRRQHEEARAGRQRAQLRAEVGPLVEEPAVGLLADERDRARGQLPREPLEARPVEVAAAQVARAGRRARGGVRDAEAELEQAELLLRVVQARREAGVVQQPPEVVARVGEVRGGRRRDAAGVDPAEDAREPGPEDVRDRAGFASSAVGHAACSAARSASRSRCRPTSSAAAAGACDATRSGAVVAHRP